MSRVVDAADGGLEAAAARIVPRAAALVPPAPKSSSGAAKGGAAKGAAAKGAAAKAAAAAAPPPVRRGTSSSSVLEDVGEAGSRALFDEIDSNNNGSLEEAELKAYFKSAGVRLSKRELKKVISDMDADASGGVSHDELAAWLSAGSSAALAVRRQLVLRLGLMGPEEVEAAEVEEEEEAAEAALAAAAAAEVAVASKSGKAKGGKSKGKAASGDAPVIDATDLLASLGAGGADVDYASRLLDAVGSALVGAASQAAMNLSKKTVAPEHVLSAVGTDELLQTVYETDSVVMNTLLLRDQDKQGFSALHAAAAAGHTECVRVLLECGADKNMAGPDRKTAIALAAERGHVECVRVLLESKAAIELVDKRKRTPLLLAMRAGRAVEASLLLSHGANPDAADDSGNTVAHYACAFGWKECVELLHTAGANLASANAMKLMPVTAAFLKGHTSTFRRMLELGVDTNFRDADGCTLLITCIAARADRETHREVQFLLERGADPTLTSSRGQTVLHALASAAPPAASVPAYVANDDEVSRLMWCKGWAARPKPTQTKQSNVSDDNGMQGMFGFGGQGGDDDDDSDDNDDGDDDGGDDGDDDGDGDAGGEMEAAEMEDEKMEAEETASVYERGWHKLTPAEREACFRLHFTEESWQAGDNPTTGWDFLSTEQREAVVTLGLDEASWEAACKPVTFISGPRQPGSSAPATTRAMAVGATADGMVDLLVWSSLSPSSSPTRTRLHVSLVLQGAEAEAAMPADHVSVALAKLLVGRGASVDALDDKGRTPLVLALKRELPDLALYLLEQGADATGSPTVSAADAEVDAAGGGGMAEEAACDLPWARLSAEQQAKAAKLGCDAAAWTAGVYFVWEQLSGELLQAARALGFCKENWRGGVSTVLLAASATASGLNLGSSTMLEVVKKLLDEGAPLAGTGSARTSALFGAIRAGNVRVAKTLVDAGATPSMDEQSGQNDLHHLVRCLWGGDSGNAAIAMELLRGFFASPAHALWTRPALKPPHVTPFHAACERFANAASTEADAEMLHELLAASSAAIDLSCWIAWADPSDKSIKTETDFPASHRTELKLPHGVLSPMSLLFGASGSGASLLGRLPSEKPQVQPTDTYQLATADKTKERLTLSEVKERYANASSPVGADTLVSPSGATSWSKIHQLGELHAFLEDRTSPARLEAEQRRVELVQMLVDRGLARQLAQGSDAHGPAPLPVLVESLGGAVATSPLVKLLLPKTHLAAARIQKRHTLLTYTLTCAVQQEADRIATVKLLLEAGCDPSQPEAPADDLDLSIESSKQGREPTPLHIAASKRSEELIEMLLDAKADARALDADGRSALHIAVACAPTNSEATFEVETVLLAAGADPMAIDSLGRTPLHYAFLKQTDGALRFDGEWLVPWHARLLRFYQRYAPSKVADVTKTLTEHKGKEAQLFETLIKQHGPEPEPDADASDADVGGTWMADGRKLLDSRIDPVETVASFCALDAIDFNRRDKAGLAPLHLAVLRGSCVSALKLATAGADLEAVWHGNTPLGLALHSHADLALLLMQKQANPSAPCRLFTLPPPPQQSGFGYYGRPPPPPPAQAAEGIEAAESTFSLAVRQLAALQKLASSGASAGGGMFGNPFGHGGQQQVDKAAASDRAAGFLGAAISALDSGYPLASALDDVISTSQFTMLTTMLPKVSTPLLRAQRFEGDQTLLHRLCQASGAAAAILKPLRTAVQRGVLLTNDALGRSPVHYAADKRDLELLRFINEQASDKLDAELQGSSQVDGSSLLCWRKDKEGVTPFGDALATSDASSALAAAHVLLHDQSASKYKLIAQALVRGEQRATVLIWCIQNDWPLGDGRGDGLGSISNSLCATLFGVDGYCGDLMAVDAHGLSCVAHATRSGTPQSLPWLWMILVWATKTGGCVDLLLLTDKRGLSPLMHAVDAGNAGVVEALLRAANGLGCVGRLVGQKAADGSSSLLRAASNDTQPMSTSIAMMCSMLKYMDAAAVEACADDLAAALACSIRRNVSPMVVALLSATPLAPAQTSVKCPNFAMAGDVVMAVAKFDGLTTEGRPKYSLGWLGKKKGGKKKWVDCLPPSSEWECLGVSSTEVDVITDCRTPQHLVELTLPAGVGPGADFVVQWGGQSRVEDGVCITTEGPGDAGAAGGFAARGASAASRTPAGVLEWRDPNGSSLLHLGVSSLPFGAFENAEIVEALLDAGVDTAATDGRGRTATDLAAKQQTHTLLRVLEARGACARSDSMEEDAEELPWPSPVDVEADAAAALATRTASTAELMVPIDSVYSRAAASSTTVARGTDGEPLDLMMTKVDLQKGWFGQNVFYRMQVLHEANQDNYILLTRWGRLGDTGQHQQTPCESLGKAETEFCKIVQSKTGNNWYESKKSFTKKTLKYQIHPIKYADETKAADVLHVDKWAWPAPTVALPSLARLLTVACDPQLLAHVLSEQRIASKPSSLEMSNLDEARTLLATISARLAETSVAQRKVPSDGAELQRLADEVAAASSRLYELVPTKNFSHMNVKPIGDDNELSQWTVRVAELHEVAIAAKLLLGAQSSNAAVPSIAPPDYLYRACGLRLSELDRGSAELALIEQYINRSAKLASMASSLATADNEAGVGRGGDASAPAVWWQAARDVQCYEDAACTALAPLVLRCGSSAAELARTATRPGGPVESICVRQKPSALWARPSDTDGSVLMCELRGGQADSSVACIHRVDHADDDQWRAQYVADSEPPSQLLFHGSSLANTLSILSSGLRVKPRAAASHQGSRFGDGVYLANTFAKSRAYCQLGESGVGVMFLCEAFTGPLLQTSANHDLKTAVVQDATEKKKRALGLAAGANLPPAAMKEIQDLQARPALANLDGVDGVESLHYLSPSGPESAGSIIHPKGCVVPCGSLVSRAGQSGGGHSASDEIVVYAPERVRVRYVLELRQKVSLFKSSASAPAQASSGVEDHDEKAYADEDGDVDEDDDEGEEGEEGEDDW